jgi:hypothetical protein
MRDLGRFLLFIAVIRFVNCLLLSHTLNGITNLFNLSIDKINTEQ